MIEDCVNSVAEAKINEYKSKIEGAVEKVLGIVGDHPRANCMLATTQALDDFAIAEREECSMRRD